MKRRLKYNALQYMDGQKVIIHDLEYDAYDQECAIKIEKNILFNNKKKIEFVKQIKFYNDEFIFLMDRNGKAINGNFEVYSL